MWHIVYIIAFTGLAVLAISNLIKNLIVLGTSARSPQSANAYGGGNRPLDKNRPVPHPELLDQDGQVIREPLLVMRSISVKDAREQLDALYDGNNAAADDGDDISRDQDS
jgi:hypothetical protein